uniref:Uncharacterized protein n=1 Tax=Setaria viridis TaxID=4556 RepID=A0A4V6D1U7_SETVI|nr:hypothetical protein SEVIR_9G405900v2 [Setaria viridis]
MMRCLCLSSSGDGSTLTDAASSSACYFGPRTKSALASEWPCLPPLLGAEDAVDDAIDGVPHDTVDVYDLVGHGGVDGLERRERIALQLDWAAVPPFPADDAHILLQHQHLEPLPLGGERECQPTNAATGHQDARLIGLRSWHCRGGDEPRAAARAAPPRCGRGGEREHRPGVAGGGGGERDRR